jgi:hypothetical protein
MFLTANQNHPSRLHVNVVKTCACSTHKQIPDRTLCGCQKYGKRNRVSFMGISFSCWTKQPTYQNRLNYSNRWKNELMDVVLSTDTDSYGGRIMQRCIQATGRPCMIVMSCTCMREKMYEKTFHFTITIHIKDVHLSSLPGKYFYG